MREADAVRYVMTLIVHEYNDTLISKNYFNQNRHALLQGKRNNYYILLKRDPFFSFGKIFGTEGIGESINKKYLDVALRSNAILFFVYQSKVYTIHSKMFKKIAEEKDYIRTTKSGELTYSIPFKELERWY